MYGKEVTDSPTHSPVIPERGKKPEIQSGLDTDVKTDNDVKLENDAIKQEHITVNDDVNNENELDGLNEKTTPTPTDYHHVNEGIEIANSDASGGFISTFSITDGIGY